jgi:hypothetical protein
MLRDDLCAGAQKQHFGQQDMPFGSVLTPRKGAAVLNEPVAKALFS